MGWSLCITLPREILTMSYQDFTRTSLAHHCIIPLHPFVYRPSINRNCMGRLDYSPLPVSASTVERFSSGTKCQFYFNSGNMQDAIYPGWMSPVNIWMRWERETWGERARWIPIRSWILIYKEAIRLERKQIADTIPFEPLDPVYFFLSSPLLLLLCSLCSSNSVLFATVGAIFEKRRTGAGSI